MLRVLHDRPLARALFVLMFKRWRHQAMASAEKLFYKVTLQLRGILAHVRNLSTTRKLLSPTCSNVWLTPATLTNTDLDCMTIVAWCIHSDLIPVEKILFVPKEDVVIPCEPTLFVDPEVVIFHNQPTLRYRVFIDIIEIEDWHTPSVSLSSGGSDIGSDGDDYIRPAFSGP
jgi:hypothetical protein